LTYTAQDAPSSSVTTSPPAKQTRKAVRRICEVELLRESYTEDELYLSPVSQLIQLHSLLNHQPFHHR
jgi:hypothetical protein